MSITRSQHGDKARALAGRLIGDSQTERWYDSIECFLSEFLEQEPRVAPFDDTSANLWLMNLEERLEHKGSFWAPPKPSICALYKVQPSVPSAMANFVFAALAPSICHWHFWAVAQLPWESSVM